MQKAILIREMRKDFAIRINSKTRKALNLQPNDWVYVTIEKAGKSDRVFTCILDKTEQINLNAIHVNHMNNMSKVCPLCEKEWTDKNKGEEYKPGLITVEG